MIEDAGSGRLSRRLLRELTTNPTEAEFGQSSGKTAEAVRRVVEEAAIRSVENKVEERNQNES